MRSQVGGNGGLDSRVSMTKGLLWIDAGNAKTVGDVRQFVRECDRLNVNDDTELLDDFFVQLTCDQPVVENVNGVAEVRMTMRP